MSRRSLLVTAIAAMTSLIIAAATLTSSARPPSPTPNDSIGKLKVDGVDGEQTLQGYEKTIDLRSFDMQFTHSGGPGGGKTAFRIMDVVVDIDKASPILLRRLVLGQDINKVTIFLLRFVEGSAFVWKKITLSDVTIDSLREYVTGQPGDTPALELSFNYGKMVVAYNVQDPAGGLGETTGFCFNRNSNTACPFP